MTVPELQNLSALLEKYQCGTVLEPFVALVKEAVDQDVERLETNTRLLNACSDFHCKCALHREIR